MFSDDRKETQSIVQEVVASITLNQFPLNIFMMWPVFVSTLINHLIWHLITHH